MYMCSTFCTDLLHVPGRCGRPAEQGGDGERVDYGNGVQESATGTGVRVSSILNHMSALQVGKMV